MSWCWRRVHFSAPPPARRGTARSNRSQVRDGTDILAFLVRHFVELMMDNPAHGWGVPPYPVVDGAGANAEVRRKTS